MSIILQETEDLCDEILEALKDMPANELGEKRLSEIMKRIEGIKNSVSRSKKKIMVRTEQGKKLSMKAKSVAVKLSNEVKELKICKSPSSAETLESVIAGIDQLEREVSKVETYWKSYEAAIT